MVERDRHEEYDNDTLLKALEERYPNNLITMIVNLLSEWQIENPCLSAM